MSYWIRYCATCAVEFVQTLWSIISSFPVLVLASRQTGLSPALRLHRTLEAQRERAAEPWMGHSACRGLIWLGFDLIRMICGKYVTVCLCVCVCEETGNRCNLTKWKFQIALLFLFTLQPQSDLCSLESLNFNCLEESLVCCFLMLLEGGCVCAGACAPVLWCSGQSHSRALPFLCLTYDLWKQELIKSSKVAKRKGKCLVTN